MIKILKLLKKEKKYISVITFLILIIISFFLFTKKIINTSNTPSHSLLNHYDEYINQSNEVIITTYNTAEKIQFKLIAKEIKHFPNRKIIQFIQPKITIFNAKNIAIWKIVSNQAIINHKQKTLYLNGYIDISNLSKNKSFQSIITNQATINLITKNICSNTIVIVHGYYFYSIGKKMNGNLHTKKMQLLNNTQTYYEIKYISYIPNHINSH